MRIIHIEGVGRIELEQRIIETEIGSPEAKELEEKLKRHERLTIETFNLDRSTFQSQFEITAYVDAPHENTRRYSYELVAMEYFEPVPMTEEEAREFIEKLVFQNSAALRGLAKL